MNRKKRKEIIKQVSEHYGIPIEKLKVLKVGKIKIRESKFLAFIKILINAILGAFYSEHDRYGK